MNKEQQLIEVITKMDDDRILRVWNEYCDSSSNYEDMVYSIAEFDEVLRDVKPYDLFKMVYFGEFAWAHRFFRLDGYGNLKGAYILTDLLYLDDLVQYCLDENDDLYDDDIRAILDEGSEE